MELTVYGCDHGDSNIVCLVAHMRRSSIHLLCVSQRQGGWNQKSQIWTHQTKGQISTGLMSIARASWPKRVSSYWCHFVMVSTTKG